MHIIIVIIIGIELGAIMVYAILSITTHIDDIIKQTFVNINKKGDLKRSPFLLIKAH